MTSSKKHSQKGHSFPSMVGYFWLMQLLLSRLSVWYASTIHPITVREGVIRSWPPQSPLGEWIERVLFAPLERWDTQYYISIASTGYSAKDGSAQFHPLFPLMAAPLVKFGISPLVSLVLFSTLTSAALLFVLNKLVRLDLNSQKSTYALLFLLCSPYAFALFIPYSEALFLCFAALTLYWSRLHKWWLAGLSAALATLTRQQGILLLLPFLWEFWESCSHSWRGVLSQLGFRATKRAASAKKDYSGKVSFNGWSLLLAPLAYTAWIIYRSVSIDRISIDFSTVNNFIYSLLLSPDAARVVPVQSFLWPWKALWLAVSKLWLDPDYDIIVNVFWGIYYICLLGISWSHLRKSYRIYCLATTLISFAYYTGPIHPYMGLVRHLLLGFPVFIGLAAKDKSPASRLTYTALGLIGYFQLIFSYSLHIWVP